VSNTFLMQQSRAQLLQSLKAERYLGGPIPTRVAVAETGVRLVGPRDVRIAWEPPALPLPAWGPAICEAQQAHAKPIYDDGIIVFEVTRYFIGQNGLHGNRVVAIPMELPRCRECGALLARLDFELNGERVVPDTQRLLPSRVRS